jgi:excisionase family DNA binding protein
MISPADTLWEYGDVAKHLKCSVRTARRLVAQKILKPLVLGHRTVRFRPADVERAKSKLAGEEVREW